MFRKIGKEINRAAHNVEKNVIRPAAQAVEKAIVKGKLDEDRDLARDALTISEAHLSEITALTTAAQTKVTAITDLFNQAESNITVELAVQKLMEAKIQLDAANTLLETLMTKQKIVIEQEALARLNKDLIIDIPDQIKEYDKVAKGIQARKDAENAASLAGTTLDSARVLIPQFEAAISAVNTLLEESLALQTRFEAEALQQPQLAPAVAPEQKEQAEEQALSLEQRVVNKVKALQDGNPLSAEASNLERIESTIKRSLDAIAEIDQAQFFKPFSEQEGFIFRILEQMIGCHECPGEKTARDMAIATQIRLRHNTMAQGKAELPGTAVPMLNLHNLHAQQQASLVLADVNDNLAPCQDAEGSSLKP